MVGRHVSSYRASLLTVLIALGTTLMPAHSADQQSLNHQLLQDARLSSAFGVEKVQQDLTNGADVNAKDDDGKTALMVAAYNIEGKPEVARVLLEHGADVNAKDSRGKTALIWATDGVHQAPEVVRVLLQHGADVNAKDKDGKTALEYARLFFHEDVANLIIAHGVANPSRQLVQDASRGSLEAVQLDLAHGADVNAKDKVGRTALMYASNNANLSRLLVEHRADVNAKDNDGETALMMAVQNRNMEVVNLLFAHSANATPMDKHGHTALEYANLGGGGKMAELISGHLPRRSAPRRSAGAENLDEDVLGAMLDGIAASKPQDWRIFFTSDRASFYYSPGSVSHHGWYGYVTWYSSALPQAIHHNKTDCMSHTIQNIFRGPVRPTNGRIQKNGGFESSFAVRTDYGAIYNGSASGAGGMRILMCAG